MFVCKILIWIFSGIFKALELLENGGSLVVVSDGIDNTIQNNDALLNAVSFHKSIDYLC